MSTKEQQIADAKQRLSAALQHAKLTQTPLTAPFFEAAQRYLENPSGENNGFVAANYNALAMKFAADAHSYKLAAENVLRRVFDLEYQSRSLEKK